MSHLRIVLALLLVLLSSSLIAQETVYISDKLYVPMRSGHSIEYRIINAAMRSGTQLTRLEMSDDGKWSKVRTSDGVEGWIKNQYLSSDMTAQLKLNQTLNRTARIEKENETLKAENASLKGQNKDLSSKSQQATQSSSQMKNELEKIKQLSAGAIELDRRYQELLEKHELTQTQRDSLLAENENLKNDQRLSFMFYGAGILIIGMFLAVILPALRPKKRYSEWK